jgi:hypothetical protein
MSGGHRRGRPSAGLSHTDPVGVKSVCITLPYAQLSQSGPWGGETVNGRTPSMKTVNGQGDLDAYGG